MHERTHDLLATSYSAVYSRLSDLRETFHRSGRLDDSNAKLDEVAKIFATYLAYRRGLIAKFPLASSSKVIHELQESFLNAAKLPQYIFNGTSKSIFGEKPSLIIRDGDEDLARELTALVRQCVDLAFELRDNDKPFDILNEAFGHFVRDNFRGNVEDAQYMTPPEVIDFMVNMVLSDLSRDTDFLSNCNKNSFTVLDPSCGVGSFLTTFYHGIKKSSLINANKLNLVGQDKVERMARLAKINLELFDSNEHRIEVGNSLGKGTYLDVIEGKVDLILTNPPFGARFSSDEVIRNFGENTPFFSSLKKITSTIDSELLFIDRNLELLRDGGRMLIVIPDGVVSSKGLSALIRKHISSVAELKAIIELPSVTFAQAGTRTKTAVIYIKKGRSPSPSKVFMAVAQDLGFQVSMRKGVQIKNAIGSNDLITILEKYEAQVFDNSNNGSVDVISSDPSCVSIDEIEVLRGSWTPKHYSASRLEAINNVKSFKSFEMTPLKDLVEFCGESRRNTRWEPGMAFLSVLHVLGEGLVDVAAAKCYAPKTPGIPIYEGEILVSRINPRIPRICMTPSFNCKTLCSSEFEVLKSSGEIDQFLLMYLLLTDTVQNQIRSLTSGTSASHNRIRTAELSSVLIPIPKNNTKAFDKLFNIALEYKACIKSISITSTRISDLREAEKNIFS